MPLQRIALLVTTSMGVQEALVAMPRATSSTFTRVILPRTTQLQEVRPSTREAVCTEELANTPTVIAVLQRDRPRRAPQDTDLRMQQAIKSALRESRAAMQVAMSASSTPPRSQTPSKNTSTRLRRRRHNCPILALVAAPAIITITVQVAPVAIVIEQDHPTSLQSEPARLERLDRARAQDPRCMGATPLLSLVVQAMLTGLSANHITFRVPMATQLAAAT